MGNALLGCIYFAYVVLVAFLYVGLLIDSGVNSVCCYGNMVVRAFIYVLAFVYSLFLLLWHHGSKRGAFLTSMSIGMSHIVIYMTYVCLIIYLSYTQS